LKIQTNDFLKLKVKECRGEKKERKRSEAKESRGKQSQQAKQAKATGLDEKWLARLASAAGVGWAGGVAGERERPKGTGQRSATKEEERTKVQSTGQW
jgi:hypothetical protein